MVIAGSSAAGFIVHDASITSQGVPVSHKQPRQRRDRFGISALALLASSGVAIDYGRAVNARRAAQAAVDAAAVGGVNMLVDGRDYKLTSETLFCSNIARLNLIDRDRITGLISTAIGNPGVKVRAVFEQDTAVMKAFGFAVAHAFSAHTACVNVAVMQISALLGRAFRKTDWRHPFLTDRLGWNESLVLLDSWIQIFVAPNQPVL